MLERPNVRLLPSVLEMAKVALASRKLVLQKVRLMWAPDSDACQELDWVTNRYKER